MIHLARHPGQGGHQPGAHPDDDDVEPQRSRRIFTELRQPKDELDEEGRPGVGCKQGC